MRGIMSIIFILLWLRIAWMPGDRNLRWMKEERLLVCMILLQSLLLPSLVSELGLMLMVGDIWMLIDWCLRLFRKGLTTLAWTLLRKSILLWLLQVNFFLLNYIYWLPSRKILINRSYWPYPIATNMAKWPYL